MDMRNKISMKRRRWLKWLGGVGLGSGAMYAYLEGLPSNVGGTDLPSGDPMTTSFPLDSVFHELKWRDTGEIAIWFVDNHDTIGFTISREDESPIRDSLYTGDSPVTSGPVIVDMSNVVRAEGQQTFELTALGGDLESVVTQPEIVTSVTFDVPQPVVESF